MDADVTSTLDAVRAGRRPSELESMTLDFKTVGRSIGDTLKDLAEAAACFANAEGGKIIVGVRDALAGAEAFVGSRLDPVATVGRIYELTEPGLIVIVDTESYHGVELSVITVPRSPDIHQVGGRATERVGSSCRPMSAARIATVLADRRGDDWSRKDSGLPLEAVSPIAEAVVRELLAQAPDQERNASGRLPWTDV